MKGTNFRGLGAIGIGCIALLALLDARNGQNTSALPQFKSGIELIRIDAAVLDRNRRPVRNLTKEDFTVLEDGVVQPIAAFTAVDMPDPPDPPSAWMRELAPDVRRNDNLGDKRIGVIILDDAMGAGDLFAERLLRKTANQIIDQTTSGDLMAVVYTADNRRSQDFTSDRQALRQAVAPYEYRTTGSQFYAERRAVDTIAKVVDALAEFPERRKIVFYLGAGLNSDIQTMLQPVRPDPRNGAFTGSDGPELYRRLVNLQTTSRRANVNLYMIDTKAIASISPNSDFFPAMSNASGGFAPGASNDYTQAVQTIFRANSSYYLIGYQNPKPDARDTFRRISVKVNRPDVDVVARGGYYYAGAPSVSEPKNRASADTTEVRQALGGFLPSAGLPMQIATAVLRPAISKEPISVGVVLGIRQSFAARTEPVTEEVEGEVEAFTTDGDSRGRRKFVSKVMVRPGSEGPIGYEVSTTLPLPPGRYQLRAAARTKSDGRVGSIFTDLVVPDFERGGALLTAPVFSTTPALPIAPHGVLEGLLPGDFTSLREFAQTMRVQVHTQVTIPRDGRGRVYPLKVLAKLVNEQNIEVFSREVSLLGQLNEQQGLISIELPVRTLPSGHYALTLSLDQPAGVKREIRFTVQ